MKEAEKKIIIEHLTTLVEQGKSIALRIKSKREENVLRIDSQAWITQVRNAFIKYLGNNSVHNNQLNNVYRKIHISFDFDVYPIVGVIQGAIEDIKNGVLDKIEKRIEISLSDDILILSKEILNQGNKDISAILNRIILERIVKRDAKESSIEIANKKTSILNDELKSSGVYQQPKWRQIQTYLDIGNSAAHGDFGEYDHKSVDRMIEYIEGLLSLQ